VISVDCSFWGGNTYNYGVLRTDDPSNLTFVNCLFNGLQATTSMSYALLVSIAGSYSTNMTLTGCSIINCTGVNFFFCIIFFQGNNYSTQVGGGIYFYSTSPSFLKMIVY
jgi:hypothetical protein